MDVAFRSVRAIGADFGWRKRPESECRVLRGGGPHLSLVSASRVHLFSIPAVQTMARMDRTDWVLMWMCSILSIR